MDITVDKWLHRNSVVRTPLAMVGELKQCRHYISRGSLLVMCTVSPSQGMFPYYSISCHPKLIIGHTTQYNIQHVVTTCKSAILLYCMCNSCAPQASFTWLFFVGAAAIVVAFIFVALLENYGSWDPVWIWTKKLAILLWCNR